MGKQRQIIWLDNNRTRTAADLDSLGHCEAFIRRISTDIEFILDEIQEIEGVPRTVQELLKQRDLPTDIPRQLRQALFYKKRGLMELQQRTKQLSA